MSDNGSKENLDSKPPETQEVLRVDLVNKQLVVKIDSNFIPMLCYANELIRVEIDKMIIDIKIREAQKNSPVIQKPHNIIDFMRRR